MSTFSPRLRVLDDSQILSIHEAALNILKKIGIKVDNGRAVELLLKAGCNIEENRIKIPSKLVEKALKTVAKGFTVYNQKGDEVMPLYKDNYFYGTGSDATFILEDNVRKVASLSDVANFSKVVDYLDNINFAMSMANPKDVPTDYIYLHVFKEMVINTNKPIVFIAERLEDISKIYEVAVTVAGSESNLEQKPFLINYSEAVSPLYFPKNVIDKLVFCAEKSIPICFPSGCNAGGGGPVTLAGAMSLGIAEGLAGLVIHQLVNSGAPFIFNPNVSVLDMRTAVVSYGCPEWSLTQSAFADMRDELYGLPVWAYAGATDSKLIDAQAGAEAMFSVITAMLSRANLIHDVAFLDAGNTSSLELLIFVDELIKMSKFFISGIPVNENTLAFDVIERVINTNSNFISDKHTAKNFRKAQFIPELLDRNTYNNWEELGTPDMYEKCSFKVKEILSSHKVEQKSKEVLERIKEIK